MLIQTIDIEAVVSRLEDHPFTRSSKKEYNRLIDTFIITSLKTFGLPLAEHFFSFKNKKEHEWYLENINVHTKLYGALTPIIRFNSVSKEFRIYRINNALFLISE